MLKVALLSIFTFLSCHTSFSIFALLSTQSLPAATKLALSFVFPVHGDGSLRPRVFLVSGA
jgi:hypothetical protein